MSTSDDARHRDLEEIRERINNGESIRSCAKLYGKRESTLRSQLKGAQTRQKGQEARQLLSPVQENDLVNFIKHEESCGRALSKIELRDLANAIANPDAPDNSVGRNWPDRFIKRNPGVKMKGSTHLDSARSNDTTPVLLRQFYTELSSIVKDKGITPSRMYNMDEHGLQEGLTKSGLVLGDALTKRAIVTESDYHNW
ncbi:transposase, partial [Fusarium beomiforme]